MLFYFILFHLWLFTFFCSSHWDLHFLHVPKKRRCWHYCLCFWWQATLLAPPVWKKHNRPLTGCLQSVGGDRQMISVQQAPPPLVPPSGDSWIAHNKFHMWQLVGVGITSLHWFDLIPSKKSARIITNHFFLLLFVCLQHLSFFFVNDCSCSFSFSLFFFFSAAECVCVCVQEIAIMPYNGWPYFPLQ